MSIFFRTHLGSVSDRAISQAYVAVARQMQFSKSSMFLMRHSRIELPRAHRLSSQTCQLLIERLQEIISHRPALSLRNYSKPEVRTHQYGFAVIRKPLFLLWIRGIPFLTVLHFIYRDSVFLIHNLTCDIFHEACEHPITLPHVSVSGRVLVASELQRLILDEWRLLHHINHFRRHVPFQSSDWCLQNDPNSSLPFFNALALRCLTG